MRQFAITLSSKGQILSTKYITVNIREDPLGEISKDFKPSTRLYRQETLLCLITQNVLSLPQRQAFIRCILTSLQAIISLIFRQYSMAKISDNKLKR